MRIEHLAHSDLTDAQRGALGALTWAVYPPEADADDPAHQLQWADTPWRVLIWDDGHHLVSHVGVLTREGTLDGESVLIGGIGGVKTHPDARRQGYAGAGMRRAAAFLNEQHAVDFSLLVCQEELLTYYQRFGWRHFQGDLLVQQESGKEPFTFNETMVLDGRRAAPEGGVIDLRGMPW